MSGWKFGEITQISKNERLKQSNINLDLRKRVSSWRWAGFEVLPTSDIMWHEISRLYVRIYDRTLCSVNISMNHCRLEARNKLLYMYDKRCTAAKNFLFKICVYKYKNTTIYFYIIKLCRDREKLVSFPSSLVSDSVLWGSVCILMWW